MWWSLLVPAISMAYEHFVGGPEREDKARKATEQSTAEYDKWLKQYQDYLNRPYLEDANSAASKSAIELAMQGVESTLAKHVADVRPQLLEELSARGVKSSGIGEYSLNKLEQQRESILGETKRQLELDALIADRAEKTRRDQEKAAFLGGQLGLAQPNVAAAKAGETSASNTGSNIMSQLAQLLGTSVATNLAGGSDIDKLIKAIQQSQSQPTQQSQSQPMASKESTGPIYGPSEFTVGGNSLGAYTGR